MTLIGRENTKHEPVLLQEVIQGLAIQANDIVFDGTAGGGGHSEAIAMILGKEGTLIACDLSRSALERVKTKLESLEGNLPTYHFVQSNFRDIATILPDCKVSKLTKIIFDLGLSSDELETSGRGFSFKNADEPLLMTYEDTPEEGAVTAALILNTWGEETIADILFGFGGERRSRAIARAIVTQREIAPFKTVQDLLDVLYRVIPRTGKINPATRTFQALRMAVNDETGSLEDGIKGAFETLEKGGRLAIISFESITDRIVKQAFVKRAKEDGGTILTKKPITPTEAEIAKNPRARSAKLRIFEK